MGIFNNILNKLGFGKKEEAAPVATPTVAATAPAAPAAPVAQAPVTPDTPVAISVVDVVGQLEALAQKHAEKLNWKTSIVDLMKLLGLDSSLAARKELATELACPAEKNGRFCTNEYVATQNRVAKIGGQRRQYPCRFALKSVSKKLTGQYQQTRQQAGLFFGYLHQGQHQHGHKPAQAQPMVLRKSAKAKRAFAPTNQPPMPVNLPQYGQNYY